MTVSYDDSSGTISFPSLGVGPLTLVGDRAAGAISSQVWPSLEGPKCTYLYTVESVLQLTGDDALTLSLRQTRSNYDCIMHYQCVEPEGGSCSTSWTMTMVLDPLKTADPDGNCY
jgi:hypothetical protein